MPAGDVRRPRPRLDPTVGKARNHAAELLGLATTGKRRPVSDPPLLLVACSGGPDSLALAAVMAFFAGRGEVRVGAVIVDHQLQPGSSAVAARTAAQLRALGLAPVEVRPVEVADDGDGPEGAARAARYRALSAAAAEHRAAAVLLGHTLDDQAESVLLGLARGSGTRSLAGIRAVRGIFARPFLGLRRAETEEICRVLELEPWHDPTNRDPGYLRSRVRSQVLPYVEDRLGSGIAGALARSAAILGHDADFLDSLAGDTFDELAEIVPGPSGENQPSEDLPGGDLPQEVRLPEAALRALAPAVRFRVLARAAVVLGGNQPSHERLLAADALLARTGSAGPVQLAGKVSVYRLARTELPRSDSGGRAPGNYGRLVFKRTVGGSLAGRGTS